MQARNRRSDASRPKGRRTVPAAGHETVCRLHKTPKYARLFTLNRQYVKRDSTE
jgi:hypothetical protein